MLLVLTAAGCAPSEHQADWHLAADAPVLLVADAQVDSIRVIPRRRAKLNALLPPALEWADGRILRLAEGRITSDSAYFASPPSAARPADWSDAPSQLRLSWCSATEALCRTTVHPITVSRSFLP